MSTRDRAEIVLDLLVSYYPFPGFMDPIHERAAAFERAHPGYRVNVTQAGYEEVPAEVARRVAEGRTPALATYYSGATQQALDTVDAAGRPVFTSLERAVGGRDEVLGEPVVTTDVIPAARDYFTRDGELVAMPFVLSTMLMYTNLTLLHAAGIEEIPRTWQELLAACRTIAARDGGPSHRITWPIDGKLFQHAIAQQGGLLLDHDNGHAAPATTVDTGCAEVRAYLDWWATLGVEGHYLYTGELEDWGANFAAFAAQRAVFRFGSSFDVNFMRAAAVEHGYEVAVSPLPHNGDVPLVGSWIGGDAFWLAAGLDDATRDGALALVQFFSAPDQVADWHERTGSTPVTESAVRTLARRCWFDTNPHHRVANDQLEATVRKEGACSPIIPGSYGVQRALMEAAEDVLVRHAEPGERLARAGREAQAALLAYHAICAGPLPRDPSWLVVGT